MKVLSAALCAALLGQEALCAEVRRPLFPKLRRTQADLAAVQTADSPDTSLDDVTPASTDASVSTDAGVVADVPVDTDASSSSSDASSDGGFPALPAVSQMTGTSADVLKALSSQAKILEAQVAQEQMENEAKLTREKTVFENKLKAQEEGNREVEAENKQISKEIENLKVGNRKLKKKAEAIEEGNKQKREELQALHSKLGTAGDFVAALLKKTFDSKKEKDLQVLSGPVDTVPVVAAMPKKAEPAVVSSPTHFLKKAENADKKEKKAEKKAEKKQKAKDKDEDKDDSDDEDEEEDDSADDDSDSNSTSTEEEADSFMEIASKRVHMAVRKGEAMQLGELADVQDALSRSLPKGVSNPKDLLNVLSSGVTNLAKAHKSSDAKLKALFVAAFKKGTQRHQKLLAQQQVLNRTRTSLQGVEQKLEVAVSHLEGRKKSLKEGLKSFGTYLQQLSKVALASQDEEKNLMKALPKEVAAPEKDQAASGDAGATGDDAAALASDSSTADADAAVVDTKDA